MTRWNEIPPDEIERRSFEIIGSTLGDTKFDPDVEAVVKRVIHTTADFDYVENLYFSETAIESGLRALRLGVNLVTGTHMAEAGINKTELKRLGGQIHCFMSDTEVAAVASSRNVTRASVSMEKACGLTNPLIIAVGNAPTALMRLSELIEDKLISPDLVIAVPVGFVNVVESKEMIKKANVQCIVAEGRKGGSNVAAAICNALLYRLTRDQ